MLNYDALTLLANGSKANTAAATGTGLDISEYTDPLIITQSIGTITGTIDGKLQACSDSGGTGAADIAGATFTQAGAPALQKITVALSAIPAGKNFLRYVGTIVTGPAVAAVVLHAPKKYNT